jgi:hypothetical protein
MISEAKGWVSPALARLYGMETAVEAPKRAGKGNICIADAQHHEGSGEVEW